MARIVLPPGEKGQFAVIPDGVYRMQIQTPKLAYARGSGAPTIECYLTVLEGAQLGERLYHQYSLQPDAVWRVRDDLRTLGRLPRDRFPVDQAVELEDTEIVRLLDGAQGWASIFTDTYKGSPRSKLATEGFLTPDELAKRGITPTAAAVAPPAAAAPPAAPPAYEPPHEELPPAAEPF